jgi:hypothetical protein
MGEAASMIGRGGAADRHSLQDDHQILRTVAALLQEHHDKFGSEAKLANAVAGILADALQLASSNDNGRLARALAPAVVGTVRKEIWNSKEEMVQALYPLAGQLVSAYVAESIAGLVNKTDEGLRSVFSVPRIALRLRSLISGVPYRTLRLAYQFGARLEAVLIVQRGGGAVLDEWEAPSRQNEHKKHGSNMIAGMLAAVNEFASEALASEGGALRTLDLGGSHVHLRATPAFIAAVKCSGRNSRSLDKYMDTVLREVVASSLRSQSAHSLPPSAGETYAGLAGKLAGQLETQLLDPPVLLGPGGRRRPIAAYIFFGLLAFLGIAALGNTVAGRVKAEQTKQRVMDIVAADKAVIPSQIQATVLDSGRTVALSGVVPSRQAAGNLTQSVRDALGDVAVTEQFLFAVPEDLLSSTVSQAEGLLAGVNGLQSRLLFSVATLGTDVTARLLDTVKVPAALLNAELNQLKLLPANLALPPLIQSQERLIAATLSGLANFQDSNAQKLAGLSKLELPLRQEHSAAGGGSPAAGGLMGLRLPVSVTDEGVKVSLLSSNGTYGAPLSLDALGLGHGGTSQGLGGVTGTVTSDVQSVSSATTATISGLSATTASTVNGLAGTTASVVTDLSGTVNKLLSPKH